jgi:hypothetical protein
VRRYHTLFDAVKPKAPPKPSVNGHPSNVGRAEKAAEHKMVARGVNAIRSQSQLGGV